MNDRQPICPTVPNPRSGTAGQAPPPSGTARGTAVGHVDLKTLAHRVLRAGQGAGQERDSAPKTPPEVCPTARDTGTGGGTAAVQRKRLLLAAAREGIDPEVIHCLDDADLEGVEHWSDCQLRTAVRWYRDDPPALWRKGVRP